MIVDPVHLPINLSVYQPIYQSSIHLSIYPPSYHEEDHGMVDHQHTNSTYQPYLQQLCIYTLINLYLCINPVTYHEEDHGMVDHQHTVLHPRGPVDSM